MENIDGYYWILFKGTLTWNEMIELTMNDDESIPAPILNCDSLILFISSF